MKEERLQLRINPELKKLALRVAKRRHTTLSALVTLLLRRAVEADEAARRVGPGEEAEQV